MRQIQSLKRFPHRCTIAPENAFGDFTIRALMVGERLFLYRVDDANRVVYVFGFRHGAQQPRVDDLPKE